MHNVESFFLVILDGKGRDTEIAIFLDTTQGLSSRSNGGFLVAAALAASRGETKGTFDRQEFGLGVVFLDGHGESSIVALWKTGTLGKKQDQGNSIHTMFRPSCDWIDGRSCRRRRQTRKHRRSPLLGGKVNNSRIHFSYKNNDLRVTGLATQTAKTRSVFQGLRHFVASDKVLEFGTGFTAQNFLKASTTSLCLFVLFRLVEVEKIEQHSSGPKNG